ncbi:GNAT family N-acetyltransferase [Patescibacteria group bacterium]|nr:GNAT family N-acetyltransferase [Patescibacteria group bacterium]
MKKGTIKIRLLEERDIKEVVDIHKKTIQSPGSAIGLPYLVKTYRSVCDDSQLARYQSVPGFAESKRAQLGFGMVAEFHKADSKRIVGAILVTYDVERFGNLRYVLSDPKIVWHLTLGIVFGRIHLRELIEHRQFQRTVRSLYQTPYVSIQALCVVGHMRRLGIGKSLVAAIIKKVREEHIPRVYVDTLTTNATARKFYSSVGFKEHAKAGDSILFILPLRRI